MIITENPECPQQCWCRHRCERLRAVPPVSNRLEGHTSVATSRRCRISVKKKKKRERKRRKRKDRRRRREEEGEERRERRKRREKKGDKSFHASGGRTIKKIVADGRLPPNKRQWINDFYLFQAQHSFVFVLRETVRVAAWHFCSRETVQRIYSIPKSPTTTLTMARSRFL